MVGSTDRGMATRGIIPGVGGDVIAVAKKKKTVVHSATTGSRSVLSLRDALADISQQRLGVIRREWSTDSPIHLLLSGYVGRALCGLSVVGRLWEKSDWLIDRPYVPTPHVSPQAELRPTRAAPLAS
jgi:hypothetical protein